MSQSFTNLIYHIVFSTKNRQPLIINEIKPRLYEYIGGILRNKGGIALEIGGMNDHIHVLAKLRPDESLSNILRDLKANSSGWMRKVFPELKDFSWQNGYGAFTVSASQIEIVQKYIANQEKHHAKFTFRDEFIKLLQANKIEFDEKIFVNLILCRPFHGLASIKNANPALMHGALCRHTLCAFVNSFKSHLKNSRRLLILYRNFPRWFVRCLTNSGVCRG